MTPEERMEAAQGIAATVISDAMAVGTYHALTDVVKALDAALALPIQDVGKGVLQEFAKGIRIKRHNVMHHLEEAGMAFPLEDEGAA